MIEQPATAQDVREYAQQLWQLDIIAGQVSEPLHSAVREAIADGRFTEEVFEAAYRHAQQSVA
jgi:hypothetical protein